MPHNREELFDLMEEAAGTGPIGVVINRILDALVASKLAVVPTEANDNPQIVQAGLAEYRHAGPYRTLYNVMVDAGNVLKRRHTRRQSKCCSQWYSLFSPPFT